MREDHGGNQPFGFSSVSDKRASLAALCTALDAASRGWLGIRGVEAELGELLVADLAALKPEVGAAVMEAAGRALRGLAVANDAFRDLFGELAGAQTNTAPQWWTGGPPEAVSGELTKEGVRLFGQDGAE